ncbi:MAG: glycosyltransferase [Cytophagales bacterium]
MKKLSVVIVNFNVCYFLEQTLKSVEKALQGIDSEVFVVDNASIDGSVEMVKNRFPHTMLIENTENAGFSKANNQAIVRAKGEYILLLNPDTVVQEDTFVKCIAFMDSHLDAGGLGVYMVDGKGNFLPESKRSFPSPWVAFYKIIGLSKFYPKSKKFGRYHLGFVDNEQVAEIEVLSGAYMFMRKKALDVVGLLDEDYFMYGEDIDLSYRIVKGGFKNYYFPETRIIHYKGESTKKSTVNYVLVFYGAMNIFVNKHFKGTFTGFFTSLIQFAIYARAIFSIVYRAAKVSFLPVVSFALIYVGVFFIKTFWETQVKDNPGLYPMSYIAINIPLYIFTWLLSIYYNGGFDKPFKAHRVLRGVFIGTILISAVLNFLDQYRYSRAIMLLGAIWVVIVMIGLQYLMQFIKNRKIQVADESIKKVIVVGDNSETQRVYQLINKTGMKANILGFISTEKYEADYENYLGNLARMADIIHIYKPNEVIFCAKNIPASEIIEWMASIGSRSVDFKIVPDESNFIIGSSSKDSAGELYTLDIHLAILEQNNIRNKRVIDFSLGILSLLLYPFLLLVVKNKMTFLPNMISVLFGSKTFVGFSSLSVHKLPRLKAGILSPTIEFESMNLDAATIHKLNLLYAKDYNTSTDLNIIFNNISKLGN